MLYIGIALFSGGSVLWIQRQQGIHLVEGQLQGLSWRHQLVRPIAFMLSEMAMCVGGIIPTSQKLLLLTFGQGVCEQDLSQIGHRQNGIVYSFPSLHWRENHISQQGHRCIL